MAKRRAKTTRKEMQLLIAKATDLFVIGCPPRRIAPQVERSETTVKRWMAQAKITPPSDKTQELWEANLIKDEAFGLFHVESIEGIALQLKAPAHVVRAAVYLAQQEANAREQ